MEYTVQKLGQMAGISARTLRYYDEIGLLKPAKINSLGYRIYGQEEVSRLQHILFYRELGVSLENIKDFLSASSFDRAAALKEHRKQLKAKKDKLDILIHNVEKTIAQLEGKASMTDDEKFEGFKQKMIEDNEALYGGETRDHYGDDVVEKANERVKKLTKKEYDEANKLSNEILSTIQSAYETGDPAGEQAQKAAGLHHQWLGYFWESYSKEAHAELAQTYVDDDRFTAYFDENQPGTAEFLRDAILIYTGIKIPANMKG